MCPGINGLSHVDIIAVLNQIQHGRSDQGITDHTVQPQASRAALLDACVSEKPLSAPRVRDNDLSLPGQPPAHLAVHGAFFLPMLRHCWTDTSTFCSGVIPVSRQ